MSDAGDTDGEEEGVSCLVGGEACVFWPYCGILEADCEGEDKELGFKKDVLADVFVEVLSKFRPRGRAKRQVFFGHVFFD